MFSILSAGERVIENQSYSETVYIVDDDRSICESLCNLLDAVGIAARCFASAEEFCAAWKGKGAGCLLLDARLPGMSGVEFQEQLAQHGVDLPVVFMTAHGDMAMVKKVLKGGAIEFLIKPFQKEELLNAIQQAFAQDRSRRQEQAQLDSIRRRIDALSERERQVMARVTAGMLNKQIAAALGLSEVTIKLYRHNVMEGMQASSLAELVKLCERVKFSYDR
jgi:FixJ family two-component response regulator